MKEIPLLTKDDIDVRVGSCGKKADGCGWATLLLYKDARCDMRILDEVYGPFGWQRTHEVIGGNLYCTVKIWSGSEWIIKQDVGVESYTEKEKGQASDSFKRACVNVGIGRELYTSPFIYVKLADDEIGEQNGKVKVNARFNVSHIFYDNQRRISALNIMDGKGKTRFHWEA